MDADTVYGRRPWQSNEERLVGESLLAANMSVEEIAAIRPPLPRLSLFPPRFSGEPRRAMGILDVLNVSANDPAASIDYSSYRSGSQYAGPSNANPLM